MDLKTFVAETLISIIEGVKSAQDRFPAGSGSAAINHADRPGAEASLPYDATAVSFDIAVTSASETESGGAKKGGLNIRVVEASVSGSKGQKERNEAISRVAFTVPVNLPVTHTSQLHDEAEQRNRETTAAMNRAKSGWAG